MREDFSAQLIALETRLLWEIRAVVDLLDQVAEAVADPSGEQAGERMRTVAARLREVSREVDAELVTVAALQAPVASDLRVVLALLQVGHHGLLIANQLELIADQLREIDPVVLDRQHVSQQAALMTKWPAGNSAGDCRRSPPATSTRPGRSGAKMMRLTESTVRSVGRPSS